MEEDKKPKANIFCFYQPTAPEEYLKKEKETKQQARKEEIVLVDGYKVLRKRTSSYAQLEDRMDNASVDDSREPVCRK